MILDKNIFLNFTASFLFLGLFLFFAGWSASFFSYAFLKLLGWVGIAFLVSWVWPRVVFGGLVAAGVIESLIGFGQFVNNESLGLSWLGESALGPMIKGVARVYLDPGLLIRAYGTFPHPNVLASFLILSLLASYYFFLKLLNYQDDRSGNLVEWIKMVRVLSGMAGWAAVIFVLWLGIVVTFARMGWLIAILATAVFLAMAWSFGFEKKRLAQLAVIVGLSVAVLVGIFYWAVAPRVLGLTWNNFTVQERLSDYQRAVELIKEKPWLGHGLTLAMGEAPIHNFYLTIAVEIGLLGLGAFILFVASLYWSGFNNWNRSVALLMLSVLLVYGLSDHFLWTLRPGLGMFWMAVGFLLKNKK